MKATMELYALEENLVLMQERLRKAADKAELAEQHVCVAQGRIEAYRKEHDHENIQSSGA